MEQTVIYVFIFSGLFFLLARLFLHALKFFIPPFDIFPSKQELKDFNFEHGGYRGPTFKKGTPFKHKILLILNYFVSLVVSIFVTNFIINIIY